MSTRRGQLKDLHVSEARSPVADYGGWAAEAFGTPKAFFREYIVINYCPLVFMGETGKNITPDKLPVAERKPLEAICDTMLRAWVEALRPERLVGVGGFAAKRLQTVFPEKKAEVGQILHQAPQAPWRIVAGPQRSMSS